MLPPPLRSPECQGMRLAVKLVVYRKHMAVLLPLYRAPGYRPNLRRCNFIGNGLSSGYFRYSLGPNTVYVSKKRTRLRKTGGMNSALGEP